MLVALATSCAMHPLGISDDTWNKMTPEQQAEAYQKQAEINAKQRAEQLAKEQEEGRKIAKIKANPKYGQYVQCVVDSASYKTFANGWNNTIENFSFDAIRDETTSTNITYLEQNNQFFKQNANLNITFDGTVIKVCDTNNFNNSCSTLTASLSRYHRGTKIPFVSGNIKGTAECNMVYYGHGHHSRAGQGSIVINI